MILPLLALSIHVFADQVWLIEVEGRDNPLLLKVSLREDSAEIVNGRVRVKASKVERKGNGIIITLPGDYVIGKGTLKLEINKGEAKGYLETNLNKDNAHGIIFTPAPPKKNAPAINGPGFQKDKDTILAKMQSQVTPGISAARIEGNRVAEVGYFGFADANVGNAVDQNSLFQAGGMGSTLTSLATVKLADEGKIKLETPVNKFLKGWQIPNRADGPVTVLDLVRGTSGLSQYKFRGYSPAAKEIPTLTQLFLGADRDQLEPVVPAEISKVENGFRGINQAILQVVLENATGKSFPRLMNDLIFSPLKMRHSTFDQNPTHATSGHYSTGEPILCGHHVYPMLGDSGLWTTGPDFAIALAEANKFLAGKPSVFLSKDLSILKRIETNLGIAGFVKGGDGIFYHGGDTYGHFSSFSINPSKATGVVVMSNRVFNFRLVNAIIAQLGG